jgi:hypothetical protein
MRFSPYPAYLTRLALAAALLGASCVVWHGCGYIVPDPAPHPRPEPRPRVEVTATPAPTLAPRAAATSTPTTPPTPDPHKSVLIAYFDNGPKGNRINVCGKLGDQPCTCGPGGTAGVATPDHRLYRCVQWDSTLKICRDPSCSQQVPCDTDHPTWYDSVCNHRDYDSAAGPATYTSSTGALLRPSWGGYQAWVEVPPGGRTEVTTCTSVPHIAADGTSWPVLSTGCHSVVKQIQ